jgi:hypothetical protein
MGHRRNYDEKKWWEYEESDRAKRRKFKRELASIKNPDASRKEIRAMTREEEADEFFERMDREHEASKKRKQMTDDEIDALVGELIGGISLLADSKKPPKED